MSGRRWGAYVTVRLRGEDHQMVSVVDDHGKIIGLFVNQACAQQYIQGCELSIVMRQMLDAHSAASLPGEILKRERTKP